MDRPFEKVIVGAEEAGDWELALAMRSKEASIDTRMA